MVKSNFIVYCVSFPNDKLYIGITSKTLEQRKYGHYHGGKKFAINNALKSYKGQETWTILKSGLSKEEACKAERSIIAMWETQAPNGYNLTSGGDGVFDCTHVRRGFVVSEETRRKISQTQIGKVVSEETRANMRASKVGYTPATAKLPHTEQRKTESARRKFNKILIVTNEQGFYKEYLSSYDAAKDLNLKATSINHCLMKNSKRHSLFGYKFTTRGI